MSVIPIKFSKKTIKQIDELVRLGIYKSRNDAIRKLVSEGLKRKNLNLVSEEVSKIIDALLEAKKMRKTPIKIITKKTAAELVAEGRDRLDDLY